MAETKLANISFRTQDALKKRFEEAFEQQVEYPSATSFLEDCLRAFIVAQRQGKRIALPLEFLTDDPKR